MISLYGKAFWLSISVVGGIALGLDDMADENAGGSDKPRNADTDTVFGTERLLHGVFFDAIVHEVMISSRHGQNSEALNCGAGRDWITVKLPNMIEKKSAKAA
eukprot:scaffold19081_cov136-Skeletonema_marinoi.AAC.3